MVNLKVAHEHEKSAKQHLNTARDTQDNFPWPHQATRTPRSS